MHEEILAQLDEVAAETVLFCRNIETLSIEGREQRLWSVIREGPEARQTVIIEHKNRSDSWTVLRETGTLPLELIEQDLQETREFEIAVGLPAYTIPESPHKLCVYFPTDDLLPAAMVAHATLSTDDSRKRLIRHDANRFILTKLAALMAKSAEQESTPQSPWRGLELLSGAEGCEQELIDLGFLDALLDSCRASNLCPRLDGSVRSPPDTMRPPHKVWEQIATASHFPEMLAPGLPERAQSFLAALELPWYGPETLGRRLESLVRGLSPSESGRVVGRLARAGAIPEGPPDLLLGSDGKFLSDDCTVFLTAREDNIKLPQWVQDFRFVHSDFMGALLDVVGDIREARELLGLADYKIEPFQVQSVAQHLLDEANAKRNTTSDDVTFVRDILRFVYELASVQRDTAGPIDVRLEVITTQGTVREARECYFGPGYPAGRLVTDLYAPLGQDEFVGSPAQLGLGDDMEAIERFLGRIGVVGEPRITSINTADEIPGFVDYILERLPYPNVLFGYTMQSVDEARWRLRVSFPNLYLPERFQEILEKSAPEAILAYILKEGRSHIDAGDHGDATLYAIQGNGRSPKPYPDVTVPDPVYYLLRTSAWVPCDDGKRRTPDRIILSRMGRFGGTFFNHALDPRHPSLTQFSGGSVIEGLRQLGAVDSLESLPADDLYRLLLELPSRDPLGNDCARIYRDLVECTGLDTDSISRARFLRDGQMWGSMNGAKAYYPVDQLRYAPSALPSLVRRQIPLVEIDLRRSAREVERIFGIKQLNPEEYQITLDRSSTVILPWKKKANQKLRKAMEYVYAYRLSCKEDDGRELTALRSAELVVCSRFAVSVSVFGGDPKTESVDSDLKGLVLRDKKPLLLLVSLAEKMPEGPVFWRAVGGLLADLIGVPGAAPDFGQLLGCRGYKEMYDLLNLTTDGQAETFIEDAAGVWTST